MQLRLTSELLAISLDGASRSPNLLNQLHLVSRRYAGWASVLDGRSPEICRGLRTDAQALAAMFALAATTDGTKALPLGGGSVTLAATGPVSQAHVGNWTQGFFSGVACRDGDALDRLCATPPEVIRASNPNADEYNYLFADALRATWLRDQQAPTLLLQALDATNPDRLRVAPAAYVLEIVVPIMTLLYRRMTGDAATFNAALAQALELHRDYWAAGDRALDAHGFLATGPIAMASLAADAGLPIEVESAYAPRWIVLGGCA